jgi:3-oxoacyl-[acyl-carrier protein] reductase
VSARVAIVTGGNRNIGAAVAERLGAGGIGVAVNFPEERVRAEAERIAGRIRGSGGRAMAVCADVSNEDRVRAMVDEVADALGPADILVNNAAISVTGQSPWEALTGEAWDRVLRVNVTGAFLCARAVFPAMKAAGHGDIINMSSVTALLGRTRNLHYVTSKAALIGFTRALAREVGPHNIRVNAIVPGAIRTPEESAYGDHEILDATILGCQSLKRRGTPLDVAGMVAFLVSADSTFVTGQCLVVDGGWVMP